MAVLKLKYPIVVGGRPIEALTLRRVDGGAMRLMDRNGVLSLMAEIDKRRTAGAADAEQLPAGMIDRLAPVFARLAGVGEEVIDALDAEDFLALFGMLEEVMPSGVPLSPATTTT